MSRLMHGLGVGLFLAVIFLILPISAFASGKQETPQASSKTLQISFGIATPGGTFYQLGAGFANLWNKHVPGVMVTGESTGGSTENMNLIATNQLGLAFSGSAYIVAARQKGLDLSNVRLISAGYSAIVQWIVRADSSIKSIQDFAGKRLDLDAPGSGTLDTALFALKTGYGLTPKNFTEELIGKKQMADALRDRTVDAGIFFAGVPTSSVLDLGSTTKIRMIPFSKTAIDKIVAADPAYSETVIPKGAYSWLKSDVPTIQVVVYLLVNKTKVTDNVVYELAKALYEHPKERDAIMPAAKKFNLKNALVGGKALGIPFDKGAIRYFKERGIWKDQ